LISGQILRGLDGKKQCRKEVATKGGDYGGLVYPPVNYNNTGEES